MIIIAKLKSGTSFRLKHRVDLSQMMVLFCNEDEEDTCAFHSSPKNALIFIWPYSGCIASFRSCDVKELWLDTLVWQIREVGGVEGTTAPCAGLLMKVLTGCNASKALVANNMDTLIDCHTEADAKKYQLLADVIGEGGICHAIESNKKRKAVISWPFTLRRSSNLSESSSPPELKTTLFDQPLSIICEEDNLPKAILDILTILRKQGPQTEGIFRKAANERARKELKDDLNYGRDLDLKSKSVHLLAVIFKDFLRGIPNQLLSSELYSRWMSSLEKPSLEEKIEEMKSAAEKLPKPNFILLRHLICVLHHISKASDINKMDARNVAVCIAPTMLIPQVDKNLPLETQKELNEKVTLLVEFFIDHCSELFGEDISQLISNLEEESLENIKSPEMSFLQNDSAYDNTGPDHECNAGTFTRYQTEQQRSSRGENEKDTIYHDMILSNLPITHFRNEVNSMDRRCSEPFIFPSQHDKPIAEKKLTRSHDDVAIRKQCLQCNNDKLPTTSPEKYCDRALYRKNMPKGLKINTNYDPNIIDDILVNASSSCSLDSSFSDCSVFTSSPLVSPLSPNKKDLPRHNSLYVKCGVMNDIIKVGQEMKKHSNSFCYAKHKKMVTKTQSWGPDRDNGGGLQRNGFSQSFRYRNQTESDGSRDKAFQHPQVVRIKPQSARKLSVDEVFRMVDQRNPGKPPSYEESVHKNVTPYSHSMTVQTMRDSVSSIDCLTPTGPSTDSIHVENISLNDIDNRPNSVTEVKMDNTCEQILPNCQPERTKSGLARTKSESSQRNKHEYINRRCSQPMFEIYDQIQYAKESYV